MGERMHKPGYMLFLESRGIRPGGYFRAQGAFGESCFRVTRDCRLLDLDGAPAALDENSLWEQLESLAPISRREFLSAREALWEARRAADGRLTDAQLTPLVRQFAQEYTEAHAEGRWKGFATWDEETLRRILMRAAALLPGIKNSREARKKAAELFREVVAAGLESGIVRRPASARDKREETEGENPPKP